MRFHQAVAFLETEQLVDFAKETDRLGYAGICLSDHLFFPRELRSRYPYSPFDDGSPVWDPTTDWPDCWCLASAMAAVTEHLVFTTNAYIAPERDLFTVAKAVGTAAVLSGGRVHLGMAAGWCAEEFEATGQDFRTRGRRLADMIPALRTLWSDEPWVEYHGPFYDFGPLKMSPTPPQVIPIYVGGHSEAAMRRAAALADGWLGAEAYPLDRAVEVADRIRRYRAEAGRPQDDFAVYLAIDPPDRPGDYEVLAEHGVTDAICVPWLIAQAGQDRTYRSSLEQKVDAAARFAADVVAKVGAR